MTGDKVKYGHWGLRNYRRYNSYNNPRNASLADYAMEGWPKKPKPSNSNIEGSIERFWRYKAYMTVVRARCALRRDHKGDW